MSEEGLWMVINHEEQYSIWPADKDIPRDWKSTGVKGDRDRCMQYFVDKLWPDMQPIVINPFSGS